MDVLKTLSKRALQKFAEATGFLVRNKIADKIKKTALTKYPNKSSSLCKQMRDKWRGQENISYTQKKDHKLLMSTDFYNKYFIRRE